ncbi:MAG: hypothetical protein AAF762_14265 [Pseudomonadota bacterium]
MRANHSPYGQTLLGRAVTPDDGANRINSRTGYARPEVVAESRGSQSQGGFAAQVSATQSVKVTQTDVYRMENPISAASGRATPGSAVNLSKIAAVARHLGKPLADVQLPECLDPRILEPWALAIVCEGFAHLAATRCQAADVLPHLLSRACSPRTRNDLAMTDRYQETRRRLIEAGYGREADLLGPTRRLSIGYDNDAIGLILAEIDSVALYAQLSPEDAHLRVDAGKRVLRQCELMRRSFRDFDAFFRAENAADRALAPGYLHAAEMEDCLGRLLERPDIRILRRLARDTESKVYRAHILPWQERQIEQHLSKAEPLMQAHAFTMADAQAIRNHGVAHRNDFKRLLARLTELA